MDLRFAFQNGKAVRDMTILKNSVKLSDLNSGALIWDTQAKRQLKATVRVSGDATLLYEGLDSKEEAGSCSHRAMFINVSRHHVSYFRIRRSKNRHLFQTADEFFAEVKSVPTLATDRECSS